MNKEEIIKLLKSQANPKNVEGMARFGINPKNTLGISISYLRDLAKKIGKNHELALDLWKTNIHEARLLAGFIDDPSQVCEKQIDSWVSDFDSWDVCDQVCMNLFDKTPYAYSKIESWCKNEKEFIRRVGFAMMATLAVHDKKAENSVFINFFPLIKKYCGGEIIIYYLDKNYQEIDLK